MRENRLLPSTITVFFEPKLAAPFLVGTISVAIVAMALYDFAKDVLNGVGLHWRYLLLALVVFVILVAAAHLFKKRYVEVTRAIKPESPVASPKKALIVLGSDEAVVRKAIKHHRVSLAHAWVIASERDLSMAQKVQSDLQGEMSIAVQEICNPGDWREASQLVKDIVAHRPKDLTADDFIVDITGLTKPASIGAFVAALQVGVQLEYTPGEYKEGPEGKKIVPLDPVQIQINLP